MKVPSSYSLAEHLARIKATETFQIAAASYGEESKKYLAEIVIALKQQVSAHQQDELTKFETTLTANALKQAASKMVTN